MELANGGRLPDGTFSSPTERVFRIAQFVDRLINDVGFATTGVLDKNLLATVVFECTKGMDKFTLATLKGILEGMMKPPNDQIGKWQAQIDQWLAPTIRLLDKQIDQKEMASQNVVYNIK